MTPTDMPLYKKVRLTVYKRMPKHSAYRSGHLVRAYKKMFTKKYGTRREPYKNAKRTRKTARRSSLNRWFKERWRNQRDEVGYKYKHDVYRPTRRINRYTPRTFREISKKRMSRAQRMKRRRGRVSRF